MLVSQKLAIAAHLHVLLRRKTGRVTDTEWMSENQEYAREVVRFARQKAKEDGHADLAEWAGKLELAVLPPADARAASGFGPSGFGERPDPDAPRYVGGIR